jgi:hypothetical protein
MQKNTMNLWTSRVQILTVILNSNLHAGWPLDESITRENAAYAEPLQICTNENKNVCLKAECLSKLMEPKLMYMLSPQENFEVQQVAVITRRFRPVHEPIPSSIWTPPSHYQHKLLMTCDNIFHPFCKPLETCILFAFNINLGSYFCDTLHNHNCILL